MEKAIRRILESILFLFFTCSTMQTKSQELFTKELNWNFNDSSSVFQSASEILKWGKSAIRKASVTSEDFEIEDYKILVMMTDACSGIYCPSIYIFVEKNKGWQLMASTQANLKERIKVEIDSLNQNIIFSTKSFQLGSLPLKVLNHSKK